MSINNELIEQISSNPQSPWIIFNVSLLSEFKIKREEKWRWCALPGVYSEVRNVDESSDDITQHQREVRLNYGSQIGQWRTDKKVKCESRYEERYSTNTIIVEELIRWTDLNIIFCFRAKINL